MRGMPMTLCVHTCNHMTTFVSREGPRGPVPHSFARVGRPWSHSAVCQFVECVEGVLLDWSRV